ncbi:hypothetical protein [Brachybacterium saurashtrense]|nr:hypothetical protein [Brachybacterium saurashtrense]
MRKSLDRYGGALLHRSRWHELGFHTRDLASQSFRTVFPGYHTPTDHPATFNAMGSVLQNRVLPGAVLSHSTAAVLWGIPIPLVLDSGVDMLRAGVVVGPAGVEQIPSVAPGMTLRDGAKLPLLHARVDRGGSSGLGRGAVVHRLRAGPTASVGRLVVSSPSEVLRELASQIPLWDLVAAADGVVGPETQCTEATLDSLVDEIAEGRGRRGTPRALAALRLARTRVRSPGETIFRLLLAEAGFPEPTLNHPVPDPVTGGTKEIDLAWAEIGLGLEFDGDGHRLTKGQWRDDERRRDELASRGWTLSRANGKDLFWPTRILLRLRRTMAQRGLRVPDDARVRSTVVDIGRRELSTRIARRHR